MNRVARDVDKSQGIVREVNRRLRRKYKTPDLQNKNDPLDELIFIILSIQTGELAYIRTWNVLRATFPTWSSLLSTPAAFRQLERVIRPAGLSRQKARHILRLLKAIQAQYGTLSLDLLQEMLPSDAERALTRLPGVGIKTARCVQMFSLQQPVFPVDTHVLRIFRRLGLVPVSLDRKKAHDSVQALVPPRIRYTLHINCIAHGRQTCTPRQPRCDHCCLNALCPKLISTDRLQ
jgi:endonuclease III